MSDLLASLPIRTENPGDVRIAIVDSSNPLLGATVDSSGNLKTSATFSGTVTVEQPTGSNLHTVVDSGSISVDNFPATQPISGTVTVVQPTGTNLHTVLDSGTLTDITNPVAVTQSGSWAVAVKDSSGNDITTANPLPVFISASVPGAEVNDYNTTTVAGNGGTNNHTYIITASKTFKGKKFWASASGLLRIDVQVSTDGSLFNTKWTGFNSAADPNINIELDVFSVTDSGVGSAIRIIRTNREKTAMDVYSTISGVEQ